MCQLSTLQSMNLNGVAFIPNSRYAWIYSTIDIAEISLGLISALIVGFSMYVFACCPIFSRNTMLLAYSIGVNFYGMLLSRLIVIFLYMAKGKSAYLLPFECVVLGTTFLNWTIFASFMYVEKINYRWYKNAQNINVGLYTLSERFQLSENVRTSRVLKETMVLCCTLNSVCQVAVFVVYFSTNPLVRQVLVVVFNFTILFYAITFVANPMCTVAPYKRKINQLFHNFCFPNTVASIQQTKTPVLIDLTGNPMSFNVSDETNVYFEALKKQWG
ncbi:Sre G protein-coupled chemoreceptor [Aphelenchoides besseyi]|nr:Sre G protein-coupled chemoreceptor [Aphelenchoides besseyi]